MQNPAPSPPAQGTESLTARMRACVAENAAKRARMTPEDHATEKNDAEVGLFQVSARMSTWATAQARDAGDAEAADYFTTHAAKCTWNAQLAGRKRIPTVGTTCSRTSPRPRGAGRPARRSARSSARSGDSGDSEPGEPPAAPPVAREAVGEAWTGILRRRHPGVSWEMQA